MKLKKIAALLLAALMVLSLLACGVKDGNKAADMNGHDTQMTGEPKNAEEAASPAATYFISPVLGNIIKGYSDSELQYSMTYRDMRLHKGVDIAADVGTPVTAAGDGTVIAVYKDVFEGRVVEIDHGNKIIVRYCGLNSAPCVKEGDRVDSSTQIGTIDNIPGESVEEHHLHVEFIKDGKFVSPEDYIQ